MDWERKLVVAERFFFRGERRELEKSCENEREGKKKE